MGFTQPYSEESWWTDQEFRLHRHEPALMQASVSANAKEHHLHT